jgi:uncharacterized protein (TIGR00297 family)
VTETSATGNELDWQSKLVLLLVLPFAGAHVLLECQWWLSESFSLVIWTLGLSALLALITWKLGTATPGAAATGAALTASLMLSTVSEPYEPWHTAMIPTLAVTALAFAATRAGRRKKERLGTAEARRGRKASQVAANLGMAALVLSGPAQAWIVNWQWLPVSAHLRGALFSLGLAALAEAAADTVSSEIGQVLGRRPRMITTLRAVEPGRNGAVSAAGTIAGFFATGVTAGAGTWALRGGWGLFWISCAGAVFGLFFDSLLGATFEEQGWLNNDAVNFLSTASAAGFALVLVAFVPHLGVG